MKIKLLFAFLLVSFFAVAQPTNYQKIAARYRWIAGMYDSTLHIPSGVTPALRGGGWTGAGAIFFNTADSSLYVYSGYNWRKIGGSYTFSNGLTEAAGAVKLGGEISESTQIYPDTEDAYNLDIGEPTPFKNIFIGARAKLVIGTTNSITDWSSEIHFYDDSLVLRPGLSKLYVDSLNYTISTTGKKLMIRDTATGLVQNIDPALLVATPTLQQVLTAGSTLTGNNTIDADGNDFSIDNIGEFLQIRSAFNGTHSLYINGGIDLVSTLVDSSSVISITPNEINILPNLGKLYIDTLDYTLSTTGKKIMLRDTATGLVENIDPALLGFGATGTLAVFGAGAGLGTDTAAFQTTSIYGSFYNDGNDTLIITKAIGVLQGSSPSITPTIYFNDSLNVTEGATKLVNSPSALTNTTTGTAVTSFDNYKIPPGVWVWCVTETVGTKPTYFSMSLIGYKKRVI